MTKSNSRLQNDDEDDEEGRAAKGKPTAVCGVCHEKGGKVYGCSRCTTVYHLKCYIPAMTQEPVENWQCLMCKTYEEVQKYPNRARKGKENLGQRDLAICQRLLFEIYKVSPQSRTFRESSILNSKEYRKIIKQPIALDMIRKKLIPDNTN